MEHGDEQDDHCKPSVSGSVPLEEPSRDKASTSAGATPAKPCTPEMIEKKRITAMSDRHMALSLEVEAIERKIKRREDELKQAQKLLSVAQKEMALNESERAELLRKIRNAKARQNAKWRSAQTPKKSESDLWGDDLADADLLGSLEKVEKAEREKKQTTGVKRKLEME